MEYGDEIEREFGWRTDASDSMRGRTFLLAVVLEAAGWIALGVAPLLWWSWDGNIAFMLAVEDHEELFVKTGWAAVGLGLLAGIAIVTARVARLVAKPRA